VPLFGRVGDATRHVILHSSYVINADFLRKMKKHAVLVNTSRGTLVDSDALAQALREKWIWGAGHPLVKEPRSVYSSSPPPPFL